MDGDALGGAQLNSPTGVAVDSSGKVYIADSANHRIRMVSGGTVSTVAGNGTGAYAGDGASATAAQLNNPNAVAVDSSGNLYIADTQNHIIRKVSGGTISLFAGTPTISGYAGDNGLAVGAALASPSGVAVDAAGNVYISDTGNNLIRRVDKTTGNITAVVGSKGTANTLNHPTGIAIDSAGAIYIADTNDQRVVKWANNKLTTIAGTGSKGFSGDGGPATKAALQNPYGVAVDASGSVYIVDSTNSRIRKVTPDGTIVTIAGTGALKYTGDGGPATSAAFNFPRGIAIDTQGKIYVADTSNQAIRMLQGVNPVISDGGVTNAASYAQQISPGALATVWGTFGASPGATAAPWPQTFNGVTVSVNGTQAPIYYVSAGPDQLPGAVEHRDRHSGGTGRCKRRVEQHSECSRGERGAGAVLQRQRGDRAEPGLFAERPLESGGRGQLHFCLPDGVGSGVASGGGRHGRARQPVSDGHIDGVGQDRHDERPGRIHRPDARDSSAWCK